MDAQVSDESVMSQLSALLEEILPVDLGQEEYRAVKAAMLRAQSGNLSAQQQFMDASEFFDFDIVQALQERAEQIMQAMKWFARQGRGKQERLLALRRMIDSLLGLDFLTFCYLVHVAHVRHRLVKSMHPHGRCTLDSNL